MSYTSQHYTTPIKLPRLIQAPMAGVSTIELAAEVTNAGGLGSIPMSSINLKTDFQTFVDTLVKYHELLNDKDTGRLMVNLNFFCHNIEKKPTSDEISDWCELYNKTLPDLPTKIDEKISDFSNGNISYKEMEKAENEDAFNALFGFWHENPKYTPTVVSFHFGYPSDRMLDQFAHLGIKILVSVTDMVTAGAVVSRYPSNRSIKGVIIQGEEAGGHHSSITSHDYSEPTRKIFDYIVRELKEWRIPVDIIPAGGIMTAEDVYSYIKDGATSVQMGSVFLACEGSKAKPYFDKLLGNGYEAPETIITSLVSGKNARTIKTPFIEKLIESDEALGSKPLPPYGYRYKAYKDLKKEIGDKTDIDLDFHLAGANYAKMPLNTSAADIVKEFSKRLDEKCGPPDNSNTPGAYSIM